MGLIYGMLCLLIIFFAGAMVLGIIMFAKESVLNNADKTGKKSYIPTERTIITCFKCGQELNSQHAFCPYCGNNKDNQGEDAKNNDFIGNIETEFNINIKNDEEENSEVVDISSEDYLNMNLEKNLSKNENAEPELAQVEDIASIQVEQKDSDYKAHNKKRNRKKSM